MADERFPRTARMKRSIEFDRVYGARCYASDDVLVLNGCRNELSATRLGLSIGRKVGNAVVRNRWKRLIREAFRLERASLPAGLDLIARPRKDARPDLLAIRRSLRYLAVRIDRRAPAATPLIPTMPTVKKQPTSAAPESPS